MELQGLSAATDHERSSKKNTSLKKFLILPHPPKQQPTAIATPILPQRRNLKPRPTPGTLRQQPQLMRLTPCR
jgi:hypothetical protein